MEQWYGTDTKLGDEIRATTASPGMNDQDSYLVIKQPSESGIERSNIFGGGTPKLTTVYVSSQMSKRLDPASNRASWQAIERSRFSVTNRMSYHEHLCASKARVKNQGMRRLDLRARGRPEGQQVRIQAFSLHVESTIKANP